MQIEQESTPELEDINYLQNQLEEIHKDVYRNVDKETFRESLNKSLSVSKEFLPIAIQESLALIGDAHTLVPGLVTANYLPICTTEIDGKFYITGSTKDHEGLIGEEILAINRHHLKEILPQISKLSSKENSETLLRDLENYLISSRILRYYGFGDKDKFSLTTKNREVDIQVNPKEKLHLRKPLRWNVDKTEHPTYYGNDIYQFRKEKGILIFQYNSCTNEGHTDQELQEFKYKLLDQIDKSEKIIVDLRQNSGGDTEVMGDLFNKFPDDKELYVAMSRTTFSSGIHHLLYLKKNKGGILIGENAGQKPNRFGDHKVIHLPNSKLRVNCSYKYFELLPGEDIDVIKPDIPIPVTINDYINNTDPLDKWINKGLIY